MEINLYDNKSIENLLSEKTKEDFDNKLAYLGSCVKNGLLKYIKNSGNSEMNLLIINKENIPLVVNKHTNNCYILSPIAHYIKYSLKEILLLEASIYKYFLISLLQFGKLFFRILNFDRVIYVNNWLFSTNPPLFLRKDELIAMRDFLNNQFPDRAIIIRSIESHNQEYLELLKSCGFELIINREVHYWDPTELQIIHNKKRKNVKQDIALSERNEFQIERLQIPDTKDFMRIAEIYQMLYISKYTELNPVFTPSFMEEIFKNRILDFTVIKKDNYIIAFISYFETESTIYPLIIGYDTNLDRTNDWNVYRMIFGILFKKSLDTKKKLFLSSGASSFKKNRGSKTQYEFEAINIQHLSNSRKLPWHLIKRGLELNAEKVYATNAF